MKFEKHFTGVKSEHESLISFSLCDLWIYTHNEYESDYYTLNLSSIDVKLFETKFKKIYIWL